MLLGGYSSCQGCGCVPCRSCTRTCTEPHSGDAFEVVYTRKFEGVEVGNTTDGYLTATGDSDTSDPYDGMDGSGPWFQQVGGGFSDGGSSGGGTRFPCTYRFSFWRSSYTLGVGTIPPASTALTMNKITLTVSTGAVVFPDGTVITPADGEVELASIPLVSGGASASDPRTNEGTVSFALQCQNVETQFSVQARIEWATEKRQHVVYGIVRECYEETGFDPCAAECDGTGRPDVLYVTISNFAMDPSFFYYSASINNVNGTYVLEREPNLCNLWAGPETGDGCAGFTNAGQFVETGPNRAFVADMRMYIRTGYSAGGLDLCMNPLVLNVPTGTMPPICGTGVIASGSSVGDANINRNDETDADGDLVGTTSCTFDWEISA